MKLSTESKKIYESIRKTYSIKDDAGLLLLRVVCESLDMIRLAEKEIEKDGLILTDKYGRTRSNPACTVIDKSRGAMLQALRQLNLDFDIDAHNK